MLFNKIKEEYLRSFYEDKPKSKDGEKPEKAFSLKNLHKLDLQASEMTYREKAALAFDQLAPSTLLQETIEKNNKVLDPNSWQDVDLICGHEATPNKHILGVIDRTQTQIGQCMLAAKMATPGKDIQQVQHQQKVVKTLSQDKKACNGLKKQLGEIKKDEGVRLGLWSKKCPLQHQNYMQALKDTFYTVFWGRSTNKLFELNPNSITQLNIFKRVKDFWYFIVIPFSPIWFGLLTLVGTLLVVLFTQGASTALTLSQHLLKQVYALITTFLSNPVMLLTSIAWILAYMYFFSYSYYIRIKSLMTFLAKHLASLQTFLRGAKHTSQLIAQHPELSHLYAKQVDVLQKLLTTGQKRQSDVQKLIYLLTKRDYRQYSFFFTPVGEMLVAYKLFQENKDVFANAFAVLASIDVDCSTATLLNDKQYKNTYVLSSIESPKNENFAAIKTDQVWHPLLDPQKAVAADLILDSEHNRTQIITGPNMAGKSSYILAHTVSIILSQSLGIASAKHFQHTLFNKVITYVNPTQNLSKGLSLAGASLMVLKKHADILANTKGPIFAAIDEILNGVNYQAGLKISFIIIRKRHTQYTNCLSLLTTHYGKIAQLMDPIPGVINSKVTAYVPEDIGQPIGYDYKITPGISSQNDILLDIVKRTNILQEADIKELDQIFNM